MLLALKSTFQNQLVVPWVPHSLHSNSYTCAPRLSRHTRIRRWKSCTPWPPAHTFSRMVQTHITTYCLGLSGVWGFNWFTYIMLWGIPRRTISKRTSQGNEVPRFLLIGGFYGWFESAHLMIQDFVCCMRGCSILPKQFWQNATLRRNGS